MSNMATSTHLLTTIRHWLNGTQMKPGDRLPAERELAEKFCVSRAELRKALAVLEDEGLIRRHVGKGTFVTSLASGLVADGEIAGRTSPLAAMQARYAIEPELARLAALNATPVQILKMRQLTKDMRKADSWDAYADLDWQFHNVIAEATGNVLLIEIQRLLNDVRRYVIWSNLEKQRAAPPTDYHSFDEHEQIVAAIERRDSAGAMQAMLTHLGGTKSQLADYRSLQASPPIF